MRTGGDICLGPPGEHAYQRVVPTLNTRDLCALVRAIDDDLISTISRLDQALLTH